MFYSQRSWSRAQPLWCWALCPLSDFLSKLQPLSMSLSEPEGRMNSLTYHWNYKLFRAVAKTYYAIVHCILPEAGSTVSRNIQLQKCITITSVMFPLHFSCFEVCSLVSSSPLSPSRQLLQVLEWTLHWNRLPGKWWHHRSWGCSRKAQCQICQWQISSTFGETTESLSRQNFSVVFINCPKGAREEIMHRSWCTD